MKKILFILLAVCILVGCQRKQDDGVVKIGAILTQSGNVSYWSNELQKGMDLAYSELTPELQSQIILQYEDNMFKPSLAISAFNKLVTVDKVDVIVTCFTPIAEALIPLSEKNKIPMIASVTSSTNIVNERKWAFRDYITQEQQCPLLADYVFNLGYKRGGYLVVNDDYGMDGLKQFSQRFQDLGGEMVYGESFSQSGELSKRNEILKLSTFNLDFIFVIARDQLLINICNQIREIDKNIQIVGINSFDTDVVWNALGINGEGILFSSGYFNNEDNNDCKQFYVKYIEKYQTAPNYTSVYGYVIMSYLIDICKEKRNKNDIREAISALCTSSIRGDIYTLPNHDVTGDVGLYMRINDSSILIK